MGKKSRRPGRKNKGPKLGVREKYLAALPLPIPLDGPDGPADPMDPRQLADFYWENFWHCSAIDKKHQLRFPLFYAYKDNVLHKDGLWNSSDTKRMKKLVRDESDLIYFRSQAQCLTLGHVIISGHRSASDHRS